MIHSEISASMSGQSILLIQYNDVSIVGIVGDRVKITKTDLIIYLYRV
jgi:hypothetical protein